MVSIDVEVAREFSIMANAHMREGASESVLRHILSANLPKMFPDNPWWVREHSVGAESNVHYIDASGLRRGFIDSLVGMTAIEYERNLGIGAVYAKGYHQVEEYCSALLNRGVDWNDIIGILSDTVHWYAFNVEVTHKPAIGGGYGPEDITLHEIDNVNLEDQTDENLDRFGLFINRYLGREGSRHLDAMTLATDMGFDSIFFKRNIEEFHHVIKDAFIDRPDYGSMIATLWNEYVSRLEDGGGWSFNKDAYLNELYMVTLAKLLCSNILNGSAIRDEGHNLRDVLSGQWFKAKGFVNIVEYDYFGWLNEAPYVDRIVTIAKQMQRDLAAYDYSHIAPEDLFGPLVAQMADNDRRLLLGQECTPQWLAEKMVARTIKLLPEGEFPNFVDMCCGSGVFIVETIKQTIEQYHIIPETCPPDMLHQLTNSVVGFDNDPLAVLLSKLNWAMAMRAFVQYADGGLSIPVYHADSLFTVAPITASIDTDYEKQDIQMSFDGEQVVFPRFLISPDSRFLFDDLIHRCYETAKARARNDAVGVYTLPQAEGLVTRLTHDTDTIVQEEQREVLVASVHILIPVLEKLQRGGRNGIWPFLLGNSYRPDLVRGQFNAIVSNPPWMTMSKLADNPYKKLLVSRAEKYGIKPSGSSHLHVELATVFLLNSVDKYLRENGVCGTIMPDTLLNGNQHKPFRDQQYLGADCPVDLRVIEIWKTTVDTFKNKAIVVFGQKVRGLNPYPIDGWQIGVQCDEPCEFRLRRRGNHTVWSFHAGVWDALREVSREIPFLQGADIMPRTLVFHEVIRQPNGQWSIRPISNQSDLHYLVKDAKCHNGFSLDVLNVDDQFIYDCYTSNHILPFYTCDPAKALLPMMKEGGQWKVMDEESLIQYGNGSSEAFRQIFIEAEETAQEYFNRINCRNKLNPQVFDTIPDEKYLVVFGAGGAYPCASYTSFAHIDKARTIIDQTLYWHIADSEDEAIYITGLINSKASNDIIADFQPEGKMGRRHVHKRIVSIIPCFNADDPAHLRVVERTRALKNGLDTALPSSEVVAYCPPSRSTLSNRRSKLRSFIQGLPEYEAYEEACQELYDNPPLKQTGLSDY